MKILNINTALNSGGAAYVAKTLVDQLSTNVKIDIKLLHGQDNKVTGNYHGVQHILLRYINAGLFRVFGNPRYGVYSSRVYKYIDEADVLHLHNLHGYWINYFKIFDRINKPTLWTWHDMWPLTGRCGFSMNCELWLKGCPRCPNKHYYPSSIGAQTYREHQNKYKFLGNNNITIVTPSRWLANLSSKSNLLLSGRVKVISNPVDSQLFNIKNKLESKKLLNINSEKPIILFVANNCNDLRKGYSDFEKAINKLDALGLVVGVPPVVKKPNIIYMGRLEDRNTLSACYSSAECFIIPTYEDNYPNTVLEAMASGIPVFGYKTGGVPEQVPANWNGLVDPGDLPLLIKKLSHFLAIDDLEKQQIKQEMRKWVVRNSSYESVANQYLDLYQKIVK